MKPGKKDIKAFMKFTEREFQILQSNTHHMDESFGLDRRIEKLTGKREVGFYRWDLDCLDGVIFYIKKDSEYKKDIKIIKSLETKIKKGFEYIDNYEH